DLIGIACSMRRGSAPLRDGLTRAGEIARGLESGVVAWGSAGSRYAHDVLADAPPAVSMQDGRNGRRAASDALRRPWVRSDDRYGPGHVGVNGAVIGELARGAERLAH